MDAAPLAALSRASAELLYSRTLRNSLLLAAGLVLFSLLASIALPKGLLLATIGDLLQVGLIAAATVVAFQNFRRSRANVRSFWLLILADGSLWLASLVVWSVYELWLQRPDPDVPAIDILLFVKLVPLTAAFALNPHASRDSRSRTFGLLDVSILMLFSLYLYTFYVFAYRLMPGAMDIYNFHFNLADGLGNQIFTWWRRSMFFAQKGPGAGCFVSVSSLRRFMGSLRTSAMSPLTRGATTRAAFTTCC